MLRETTQTKVPDGAPVVPPPAKPPTHEQLVEERLDLIVEYLHRAERRDRWRAVGSFVRSIVALIPFIAFAASLWYVYAHGEDLMDKIAESAAQRAASYSQDSMGNLFDRFQQYLPGAQGSSSSARRN